MFFFSQQLFGGRKYSEEYHVKFTSKEGTQTEKRVAAELWEAWFPHSLAKQIQEIDSPLEFMVGELDEITHASRIAEVMETSPLGLKEVMIIRGANHLDVLMTGAFQIGAWIDRIADFYRKEDVTIANPKEENFEWVQDLGKGAFGAVFLAQHKDSEKFVAIKRLRKSKISRMGALEVRHVIQERDILKTVHHPFAVKFLGSFQTPQNLFIIMEYVIGGELFTHLKLEGKFEEEKVKFYVAELISFFEYFHGNNMIFRDLKLENVLIDNEGHIKVTDFGFSQILDETKRTRTLCGTPEYLSPEMIARQTYTVAVDYWALGVLTFEMLTGQPPFFGYDQKTLFRKILYRDVDFPSYISSRAKDFINEVWLPLSLSLSLFR